MQQGSVCVSVPVPVCGHLGGVVKVPLVLSVTA